MKFDLKGYNIDNLLKTLYIKKVVLFNVKRIGQDEVSFEIFDKDEKKVKRHISNFKVKTKLSFFKRLPQIVFSRLGVVLGLCVGLVLSLVLKNYTWQICIYGTKDLSVSEITQVLKNNGIKTGKINPESSEDIETILLNNYDRIAQVSVIKQGNAIIINLSEKLVYIEEKFQPICAKYSGIITELNIITGTTNVKVGDYVNVGDVLVLPFNVNANGEKVSVKPIAEIYAEIYVVGKAEILKFEQVLVRTGRRKKVYKYKFNNLPLFSGKNKNSFDLFEIVSYNEFISGLLPLNRDVTEYFELAKVKVEHNFSLEQDELKQKSYILAQEQLPQNAVRLNEKTEISITEEKMFATTIITTNGLIND